jgi:ubiquinone/menaquinone biosynthesis C-methylase UbiE
MPWLKKHTSEPLAVAMTGVKLADRVLIVGCSDPALIGALAIKSGLTGRACAVDAVAALVERTARTVERNGALVETSTTPLTSLPFAAGSFDVVVLRDVLGGAAASERLQMVAEAQRVTRPGGRCIVIETSTRAGLGGLLSRPVNTEFLGSGGGAPPLTPTGVVVVRTPA